MRTQRGFTLIEVMIVLAIIGAVMAVAAPRLFRPNVNIRSIVHKLTIQSKEIRNRARLAGATFRLVIEMEGDNHKYWVERSSGPQPVDPEAIKEALEKEKSNDKDEEAPPPLFQVDKSILRKPEELPKGLRFGSVETASNPESTTSGKAYVHFFPQGFVEGSAIQITDGAKLTWTIIFNPLTGQPDIFEKAQSLKDLQR